MDITQACQRLQKNDASLTLLNLSCEGIGSAGVKKLSESCRCHPTRSPIVALWLENDYIHEKGAMALVEVISASPSLKYLYLAHNCINNTGITELAPTAFQKLTVCNLADNEIGRMGARSIAENLCDQKSTLKTLILESNRLRDQGAISIAKSLKENTTLQMLDLRFNQIGIEGLRALRDVMVKDNQTLEYLLLEEEDDQCEQPQTKHRHRPRRTKCPRLFKEYKRACSCERCKIRAGIDYYLALNRAGRHVFGNIEISAGLWPRMLERVTWDDPSMIYAMLCERPDVAAS